MPDHELAQINLARAKYDLNNPRMQGFVDSIDRINSLAEASPGFVWRLIDPADPPSYVQADSDPRLLINMSVWTDVQSLKAFVYKSVHAKLVGQRKLWFDAMDGPSQVLWWIAKGHRPTIEEGMARIKQLASEGASPAAFTFNTVATSPAVGNTKPRGSQSL